MSIQLDPGNSSIDTRETIDNPERGCGYMEDGKAYLKADTGPGGVLPAFVVFDQAIPFKENRKRSYTRFPGIQFELSVTGSGGMTQTEPRGEVWEHLDRLDADRPTGETAGDMVEFHSQDLLLSVGKTHYPDVDDFINEARVHGVSKAISVTSGNEPPEVNPGRTRLFLIHPNAVEIERQVETTIGEMREGDEIMDIDVATASVDDRLQDLDDDIGVTVHRTMTIPGVFGYTYLTRVVYTEDSDGNVPAYIKDYEKTGDLDIVRTGREIPYSEQVGFNDDGELTGDAAEALEAHYGDETTNDRVHTEPRGRVDDAANKLFELDDYPELRHRALALSDTEPIDLNEQYPALEAPTIDDMEKAPLGELAEMGTVEAQRPPDGEDHFVDGEGALAVVQLDEHQYKIMPSNIMSVDEEGRSVTTQLGPYSVTVSSPVGGTAARAVEVVNTR